MPPIAPFFTTFFELRTLGHYLCVARRGHDCQHQHLTVIQQLDRPWHPPLSASWSTVAIFVVDRLSQYQRIHHHQPSA
jgi:hypothetical protein